MSVSAVQDWYRASQDTTEWNINSHGDAVVYFPPADGCQAILGATWNAPADTVLQVETPSGVVVWAATGKKGDGFFNVPLMVGHKGDDMLVRLVGGGSLGIKGHRVLTAGRGDCLRYGGRGLIKVKPMEPLKVSGSEDRPGPG